MKLLLTSNGLTNKSITKALFDLVGKKPQDISLAFIPTAANIETGNKGWVIDHLIGLKKQNFKSIDIVDIAALDKKIWRPRLEAADVLFFEGGDTHYLMSWINKSGLAKILPELLKTKVYVGLSAGSMVMGIDLATKLALWLYEEDTPKAKNIRCLNFLNFYFLPHFNSPHFNVRKESFIRKVTKGITKKIYVLDDNSALKIVNGKIEVISEGKWFIIN